MRLKENSQYILVGKLDETIYYFDIFSDKLLTIESKTNSWGAVIGIVAGIVAGSVIQSISSIIKIESNYIRFLLVILTYMLSTFVAKVFINYNLVRIKFKESNITIEDTTRLIRNAKIEGIIIYLFITFFYFFIIISGSYIILSNEMSSFIIFAIISVMSNWLRLKYPYSVRRRVLKKIK